MAKKKAVKDAPVVAELGGEDVAVSAVTVSWRGRSREYSLAVHGEKFMDLAQEFAAKVSGTLEPLA